MLVAGVGLLGWVGWQYYGTGIASNKAMGEAEKSLRQQWRTPAPNSAATSAPTSGKAFVLLRIPRFGADWEKPVVEGVDPDDLARGIGHYPETQLPVSQATSRSRGTGSRTARRSASYSTYVRVIWSSSRPRMLSTRTSWTARRAT